MVDFFFQQKPDTRKNGILELNPQCKCESYWTAEREALTATLAARAERQGWGLKALIVNKNPTKLQMVTWGVLAMVSGLLVTCGWLGPLGSLQELAGDLHFAPP